MIVAILFDVTTKRFHPTWMTYSPFPSDDGSGPCRYRSRGHHTDGLDTLAGAQEAADTLAGKLGASIVFRSRVMPVEIGDGFHFTHIFPPEPREECWGVPADQAAA